MAVEDLDLVERGLLHFGQVSHELLVVHLELAQVANTVPLGVILRQLPLLVAADLTDGFTAALAVPDGVPIEQANLVGEWSLTELTGFSGIAILLDRLEVQAIW